MRATPADHLFHGGRIYSCDRSARYPESVALRAGLIEAVGTTRELAHLVTPQTEIVDLRGRTLVPGFYDAHQHQIYGGLARLNVNARVSSIGQLVERVRAAANAATQDSWVEGGGWDESQIAERRTPSRDDLDRASPDRPTFLTRTCGHAMVVNTPGLTAAGITASTPDPAGGLIERDEAGSPTGVLHERAMELVRRVVPLPSPADLERVILSEAAVNLGLGITSLWEPSVEPPHVAAYTRLADDGRLPIRVTMAHKRVLRSGETVPLPTVARSDMLSLVAVKLFQDGAIGARSAAISAPYPGEPENTGILIWDQDSLDEHVAAIHDAGIQASVHAIGDAAIASALTAIERAAARTPRSDARHRIEHCGIPSGELPHRLARAGVIGVLQPFFLWFHGERYLQNLGTAFAGDLYPTKRLLDAGVPLAFSSDAPVVPEQSPVFGMKCAMTRVTSTGRAIVPEEAVDLECALELFTIAAAYAAHEEARKGSLTPGKLADLVVLDQDLATVDVDDLDSVAISEVFLGGRRVI